MDRINVILQNNKFKEYLRKNEIYEKERVFCCHNLQHFLDVARIAYIMTLENNIKIHKEVVYGAALLHDIGRWMQYENGRPHEIASHAIAKEILMECGYEKDEINIILNAIINHRKQNNKKGTFDYIFYLSDKLSRNCLSCKVATECKWSEEMKNYKIVY